jgi:hypothetical protein
MKDTVENLKKIAEYYGLECEIEQTANEYMEEGLSEIDAYYAAFDDWDI